MVVAVGGQRRFGMGEVSSEVIRQRLAVPEGHFAAGFFEYGQRGAGIPVVDGVLIDIDVADLSYQAAHLVSHAVD